MASVRREDGGGDGFRATAWCREWVAGCGTHDTIEEAMAAADHALIADGWKLL